MKKYIYIYICSKHFLSHSIRSQALKTPELMDKTHLRTKYSTFKTI